LFDQLTAVAGEGAGGVVDERLRVVHGDGDLGGAGGDQLQLAVKGGDVSGRVDARQVRFHAAVHLDAAAAHLQAPFADRTQVGDKAEAEDHRVDGQIALLVRLVVIDRHAAETAVFHAERLHLPEQVHFAGGSEQLF